MIAFDFLMGVLTGLAVGICVFFLYAALCLEKIEKKINGGEKMKINYLKDLIRACRMIIGTGEFLKTCQGMTVGSMQRLIKELQEYLDKLDPNVFL